MWPYLPRCSPFPPPAARQARTVPELDRETRPEREAGLALIATLLVVALLGALTAAAISASLINLRVSVADYEEARSFYAAEAGAEAALAAVHVAVQDGFVSDDELANISPPELEGFDYSGFEVRKLGEASVETITDGPFAGLYALTQDFEIISRATDRSGAHSGVAVAVTGHAVPIFQFGVFYEQDLEIHPGPPMDFYGRVHSNSDIYLNSNNVYFHELITTPERAIWNYKGQNRRRSGVFIDDASGDRVQLTFDSRDIDDPEGFKARSEEDFDGRLQTGAFGLERLNLPLPTGVEPYELIRPQEDGDTQLEMNSKLAWLADMYVIVDLRNLGERGAVCGSGGTDPHPSISITHPGGNPPTGSTLCAIFDWQFEQFFDSREMKPVDVLNLDIGQLNGWINASPTGNRTSLIYVAFVVPSSSFPGGPPDESDPSRDGFYPVVRVRNGSTLPGPLTIASEHPLYVLGNYNSQDKKPAALAGDALTVLSNSWDDSDHQGVRLGGAMTGASRTTVYASILTGHSASDCDVIDDPGCTAPFREIYGGGLENFPRFLETWRDIEFEYRGSLVSLWLARHAEGEFVTPSGSQRYYFPPNRNWGFDLDLLDPANLPPGTPVVGQVLRTGFREVY